MESKNQTVRHFYARRYLLLLGIICFVAIIPLLISHSTLDLLIAFSLITFFIISIFLQYNMIYVKIGQDFITLKPSLREIEQTVFFKDITSIKYKPNCVYINYNNIEHANLTLNLYTTHLTYKTKTDLLNSLHTIFEEIEKI